MLVERSNRWICVLWSKIIKQAGHTKRRCQMFTTWFQKVALCRDYNCDFTTIRLRRTARACFHSMRFDASKKWTSVLRCSRVVVVSQSNGTQIVISVTSVVVECIVASSYRSRIVVESQLWYRLKTIPQEIDTSSLWPQSWTPHPRWRQDANDVSEPVHRTLSNHIGPDPGP